MAVQGQMFFSQTLEAATDLSGKEYHFMRLDTDGKVNVCSDGGDFACVGVLQNKPESGEFATVAKGGKQKVVSGAAVSVGDMITNNGSGRAISISSGDTATVHGLALEASGADGEVITFTANQSLYVWPGSAI